MNLAVIILAAGRSKRFKSPTPKVIYDILGKPVLAYTLDKINVPEFKRKIVVINRNSNNLIQKFSNYTQLEWVEQKQQLGTADAVLSCEKALSNFSGYVLILNADMPLISEKSIKQLILTGTNEGNYLSLGVARTSSPFGLGRIIRDNYSGMIIDIREEKNLQEMEKLINEINVGLYLIKWPETLKYLKQIKPDKKTKEYYLTDIVRILVKNNHKIGEITIDDEKETYGINTYEELVKVNEVVRRNIISNLIRDGVEVISPELVYIENNVEIGEHTIIYPFTVIEAGVKIGKHCKVGPFSHLRGNTIIKDYAEIGNFVEIKSSLIGRFTKAKHLSYLGDATIGKEVNIGAGTITANYDGKNKNKTIIEDKAFTGVNTVFVAPVRMGKGAKTGAGSVVLKNRDIKPYDVVAGVPARSILDKISKIK